MTTRWPGGQVGSVPRCNALNIQRVRDLNARPVYSVFCITEHDEHWRTPDEEAAWAEATAHERATGHETRVSTERSEASSSSSSSSDRGTEGSAS